MLLYHAKIPGFGGGYVGVDVFFVLSGFLITGILYREVRSTGHISIGNFYARRARRLLPAAGLVLLCTLVASVVVLPSIRLPAVTTDVVSAGLYVSNMRFGIEANDYFEATSAVSPVLHFWSLSVEEQFYVFWPVVLLIAASGWRRTGTVQTRVAVAMIGLGALSLVAGIWLTGVNQPWAFYLLPTRAWELAAGGLLAVLAVRLSAVPRPLASFATVAGIACVVAAALRFDDATPFPGFAALLPVAGSALVILGGFPEPATIPGGVLSVAPLRFLGRISYSLYLWHWPILVFGSAILGAAWLPVLAIAAVPVAAASQRWVEEPFRRGRFVGMRPRSNLIQAGFLGLIIVAVAVGISPPGDRSTPGTTGSALPTPIVGSLPSGGPSSSGTSATLPPDNPPEPCSGCSIGDLSPSLIDPKAGRIEGCNDAEIPDLRRCVLGYAVGPTVAVFGDSHGANLTPALQQLAVLHGWRLVDLTQGGCPSVSTATYSLSLKREHTECDVWREAVFARLAAEKPALVIISNVSEWPLMDGTNHIDPAVTPPTRWAELWSNGLATTLSRLAPLTSKVVVIGDVPNPSRATFDPLACIAEHPTTFDTCRAPRDPAVASGVHDLERGVAESNGALFVDPSGWLCDATTCPAVIARYLVYADDTGHLTAPFARSLAGRLLAGVPFPT